MVMIGRNISCLFELAALAGVFFALIAGWLAGVLAAGLLSFYWLIRFRQLKIEPF